MHTKGPHGGAALRLGGSKKPRRSVWSCCACAAGVTQRGQRLPCRASTESTGAYCTTHWKRRQPSSRRPCARLSTAPARCGGGHGTFSTRCRVSEKRARQGNTGARGPPAAARVRRPHRQGGKEKEQAGTVLYLSSPCLFVTRRIIGTVHGSKVDHRSHRERGYPCGQKPDPQRPPARPPTRAPFHPHHRDPTLCPALSHPRARADD